MELSVETYAGEVSTAANIATHIQLEQGSSQASNQHNGCIH